MDKFEAYPTATGSNASAMPRFSLRKVNYAVSPPGPFAGQKRSTRDEDNGDNETQDTTIPSDIERQRKLVEAEYVDTILRAIRDFFVIGTTEWLRKYYHSAVVTLQHINDHRNIAAICGELEASLQYWASWHADQLVQNLQIDSEADCEAFLDAYTLVLANWSARAGRLRTCFAWIEVQYRHRDRRSQRGIIDSARKAIDSRFVRNRSLWEAVHIALDKLVLWSRPLKTQVLARVALLEHVYTLKVLGLRRNPVFTDPLLQQVDQQLPYSSWQSEPDLATAVFSPVLRVLQKGTQYASQQVFLRRVPNMLEDWATRASYWTTCINTVFAYLLDEVQLRHRSPDSQKARVQPEWHTSHKYLEDWLPLMAPHIAAYALGTTKVPQLAAFIHSACSFPATQKLVLDNLANIMQRLTEQLTSLTDKAPVVERIHLLELARSNLMTLCDKESQDEVKARLTKAMQEAVRTNAGSLLVQLRHSVQSGHQQTPLAELQNLNLNLTLEDGQDDEIHSRMLAEDVAVDLLPTSLGGSAVDPRSELEVLTTVAGDFKDHGVAFTWMPLVMASEATKFLKGRPLLLHYVAWPATRDPLLTPDIPPSLAPFVQGTDEPLEVKWHPAWSVVDVHIGQLSFRCSVLQYEIIMTLLNSKTPVPESDLVARGDGEAEEASLVRRAALLDLVKNSDGFLRYSRAVAGGIEYAADTSKLPIGSTAVARFFEDV